MAGGTLRQAGGRLATPAGEDSRDRLNLWRRWYKTARWRKLRWKILLRDRFTCQMTGCGRVEHDTSRLVADHRVRHGGDASLFWDEANLQTLCKSCHDGTKQAGERG